MLTTLRPNIMPDSRHSTLCVGEESTKTATMRPMSFPYMFLEAEKQVPLYQPEFAARIHKQRQPLEYLLKLADVQVCHGKPKMFVDDTAIPALMSRGKP